MPLYDCMLLLKPHVTRDRLTELVSRVGRHVYARKGVLTNIKSFGSVHLGYGIRKRDGKFFEGQFMQMSMMVPPDFHRELHYLNKEDRLLRWLVVKHRGVKYGMDFFGGEDGSSDMIRRPRGTIGVDDEDDDDDDDEEDDVEDEKDDE